MCPSRWTDDIAAAAARLVVEEGLDYAAAKRRAVADLVRHHGRRTELPSHEAIEDAVREHLRLFWADRQPAELRALRELAALWMDRLAEFDPHLAGPVWRGTATRLSPIWIDLYCDDPKSAEIACLNAGIDFDSQGGESDEGWGILTTVARCPALSESVTLHLRVNARDALRGALQPDGRGRSWRGSRTALSALLNLETEDDR